MRTACGRAGHWVIPYQVFMSSCNSVKFHAELLNYIDIPVLDIHVSRQISQTLFQVVIWFREIKNKQRGLLRSSSFAMLRREFFSALTVSEEPRVRKRVDSCIVAARGLDIPAVDWIIQYDPPDNPKVRGFEYLLLSVG